MEKKSKTSWKLLVMLFFILISNAGFIFIFGLLISDTKKIPLDVFVLPTVFLLLLFPLSLITLRSLKTITITNNEIIINFLFRKNYRVTFVELEGKYERHSFDKLGEYVTFYFRTNSNIFKFGSREFKNYDELAQLIASKTKPTQINIFFELKTFLKILLITAIILSLTIWFGNK